MSRHGGVARRLLTVLVGVALVVGGQVAFGVPAVAAGSVAGAPGGRPQRPDTSAGTRSVNHLPAVPAAVRPAPAEFKPRPAPAVPMRPALVGLDPSAGAHLVGSDGVLEVTAPAGAVTAADVAAAGGG